MKDVDDHDSRPGVCPIAPGGVTSLEIDPDGDLRVIVGQPICLTASSEPATPSVTDPGAASESTAQSQSEEAAQSQLEETVEPHDHELPVEFRVDAHTLGRASLVWKRMLFGNWSEGKRGRTDWQVNFPEDNPNAMKVIFAIIHTRFDLVPDLNEGKSLEELYQITVLTDKYDLAHVLRPWVYWWIEQLSDEHTSLEKRLWIAWEFGEIDTFSVVAFKLMLHCQTDHNGALQLFSTSLEPSGSLDLITASRLHTIGELLRLFENGIEALLSSPGSWRVCQDKSTDCESFMLGSLIRFLSAQDLWPLPSSSEVQFSVLGLQTRLQAGPSSGLCRYGPSCAPIAQVHEEINKIVWGAEICLTEPQVNHLEAQARKTGFHNR